MNDKLESLLALLKDAPNEPFILFALAQECVKKGLDSEALRYYQRIVEFNPEYTGVYYHLGKLHEQMGNVPEAIVVYEMGLVVTRKKGEMHAYGELQSALSLVQ